MAVAPAGLLAMIMGYQGPRAALRFALASGYLILAPSARLPGPNPAQCLTHEDLPREVEAERLELIDTTLNPGTLTG
ncbi:MAG TPA: hypothetical protein VGJ37_02825 [Pyrinomonadaceae bacterium]